MKKLLIIIFIGVIMFYNKPDYYDYREAVKNKVIQESNNNFLVTAGVRTLGNLVLDETSACADAVILTYCRTNLDENVLVGIGAFNKFFVFKL